MSARKFLDQNVAPCHTVVQLALFGEFCSEFFFTALGIPRYKLRRIAVVHFDKDSFLLFRDRVSQTGHMRLDSSICFSYGGMSFLE